MAPVPLKAGKLAWHSRHVSRTFAAPAFADWRIRAVRDTRAPFKSHRTVLEGERAALIAMTGQTTRLIGSKALHHRGTHGPSGSVAIDATHRAFRQLMVIRPLELRPNIEVATGTLLIDGRGFCDPPIHLAVGVNLMTGSAGHLVFHVTASRRPTWVG